MPLDGAVFTTMAGLCAGEHKLLLPGHDRSGFQQHRRHEGTVQHEQVILRSSCKGTADELASETNKKPSGKAAVTQSCR